MISKGDFGSGKGAGFLNCPKPPCQAQGELPKKQPRIERDHMRASSNGPRQPSFEIDQCDDIFVIQDCMHACGERADMNDRESESELLMQPFLNWMC